MNRLRLSTPLFLLLLLPPRVQISVITLQGRHAPSRGTALLAFLPHSTRARSSSAHRSSASDGDPLALDYALKERNPYDVHVYYSNQRQQEEALALRKTMAERFSWMRFYPPKGRPLGPHPVPMWEADFGGYEHRDKLGEVCIFLRDAHGSLSVLVHPHSQDGDYADHTRHALWFGEALDLRIGGWKRD